MIIFSNRLTKGLIRLCVSAGWSAPMLFGLVARKPVFGVSDEVILKPVCSATETSKKIEISLVGSLDIILSKKRIAKALIKLRGYAGWSAHLMFANPRRLVSRPK